MSFQGYHVTLKPAFNNSFQIRLSIYDFSGQIEKSREIDVVIISRAQRCYLTNANPAISFMGRMKVISYKLFLSAEAISLKTME